MYKSSFSTLNISERRTMNINIRESIKNNFINSNKEDIKESIVASLNDQDEIILPGLGVFFEIIWSNSNDNFKNEVLEILELSLKKH